MQRFDRPETPAAEAAAAPVTPAAHDARRARSTKIWAGRRVRARREEEPARAIIPLSEASKADHARLDSLRDYARAISSPLNGGHR